jgi:hypothetical protein
MVAEDNICAKIKFLKQFMDVLPPLPGLHVQAVLYFDMR